MPLEGPSHYRALERALARRPPRLQFPPLRVIRRRSSAYCHDASQLATLNPEEMAQNHGPHSAEVRRQRAVVNAVVTAISWGLHTA